ncbi:hypothetical protein UM719_07705 [Staphylococcus aureus]|nr:hypothetical protein UM719_07705 [Staphylococcus aureus]
METYKIKMPYYINQNSYYINELNQSMHRALEKVKENDRIILDFTNTEWFNAELTVLLSDYIETFHEKNIHVEVSGLKKAIEIILRKNHFLLIIKFLNLYQINITRLSVLQSIILTI